MPDDIIPPPQGKSYTLKFTAEASQELDELLPKTRCEKPVELLRVALRTVATIVELQEKGDRFVLQTKDGILREFEFPFFPPNS